MDKFETSSNISAAYSTSNLSSISGLTGYEDEINEIRNIIDLSSSEQKTPTKSRTRENPESFSYEIRISNLTSELQNVLKLNEKYKNDLFNLQRQQELNYHEKFEKLLKKSSYLEAQLDNANLLIAKLKVKDNKNEAPNQQRLEVENFSLKSLVNKRDAELDLLRVENGALGASLRAAEVKLGELDEGFKIKAACVDELKRKIGEQHIEIQELLQRDVRGVNNLTALENELDGHKKSLEWYKKRVDESHVERNKLTVDLSVVRNQVFNANREVERLKEEIADWKCKYRELGVIYERDKNYYNAVKERDCVDKNLEKAAVLNKSIDAGLEVDNMRIFYEKEVADITNEMVKVKRAIEEQNTQYDRIVKENAELHSRNTTFQKMLNDREMQLEIDKSVKADLTNKHEDALKAVHLKEKQMLELKTNAEKIKLKLANVVKERDELSEATLVIRRDFQKFLEIHKELKIQLDEKNKLLMDLQKHKQELFMQNNWSVCELEEFKHKEKDYLTKINELSRALVDQKLAEASVAKLEKIITELKAENCEAKASAGEVLLLRKQVCELSASIADYEHKIGFYKHTIEELNVCVGNSEQSVRVKERDFENMKMVFGNIVEILCNKLDGFCNNEISEGSIKDEVYRKRKCLYNNNLASYFNYNNATVPNSSNFFDDLKVANNFFDDLKVANKNDSAETAFLNDDDFKMIIDKVDAMVLKCRQYFVKVKEDFRRGSVLRKRVLKSELYERLKMLENRSYLLTEKCLRTENAFCKLELVFGKGMSCKRNDSEDILKLQAVIKVKDLEMEEKRKRYELNNRTLLRKIKEHMRGRNSAEKQCKYLQDLYNNTVETLNSNKLLMSEREYEIERYKKAIENKERALEKLQNSVANLETQLNQTCVGCAENEEVKKRLSDVEVELVTAVNNLDVQNGKVKAKEATIEALKKQLSDLSQELNTLQITHSNCNFVYKELTNEINERRIQYEDLQKQLDAIHQKYNHLNEQYSNLQVENGEALNLKKLLEFERDSLKEKNEYFTKEIEMVNCSLHQKDVEIDSLKSQKEEDSHKEDRLQDMLRKYEAELKDVRNAVNLVNREKYFLQRLSNDLKVALNITLKQNENLKEKLSTHNMDSDFSSLPEFLSNIPGPSNYDDTRIKNLVKITDNLEKQKPLSNLHESLNSLKKEMAALQQQITEKKYAASSL